MSIYFKLHEVRSKSKGESRQLSRIYQNEMDTRGETLHDIVE